MLLASGLCVPYWEPAELYCGLIYNRTLRPDKKHNQLNSPDDIYYGVQMDMHKFQPFVRRKVFEIWLERFRKLLSPTDISLEEKLVHKSLVRDVKLK